MQFVFIVCQVEGHQNILNQAADRLLLPRTKLACFYLIQSFFKKEKEVWN